MEVVVRPITEGDRARFAARIPFWGGSHNGLICCDTKTGAMLVQEPTHPSAEGIKFQVLFDGSFTGLQWTSGGFQFFDISPLLKPKLAEVRAFVWAACKANQLQWELFVPPDSPAFQRL